MQIIVYFSTSNLKYEFKYYIEEGDKTVVPLKYFLIGYIQYLEDNDIKINDVDFFLIHEIFQY